MPKLTESELLARDGQRDLDAELLESIELLKSGQVGRVTLVTRTGQLQLNPSAQSGFAISSPNPFRLSGAPIKPYIILTSGGIDSNRVSSI